MAMGGVFSLSGSRPGAIVSAVALGVLLSLAAADVARSFVPAAAGAARVLAPGMLRTLSTATENAAAIVGGGVRVTVQQAANVGGVGVLATLTRTASRDSLAKAMAGLAAGAGVAALLDEALDSVDCDLGASGFKCAAPSDPQLVAVKCYSLGLVTGLCGGTNQNPPQACFSSQSAFEADVAQKFTAAGRSPSFVSRSGGASWVVTYSIVNQSNCTSRTNLSTSTTVNKNETTCPAGFESSKNTTGKCRPVDAATWPSATSSAVYDRLRVKDGWVSVPVARELGNTGAEIPDEEAPTVVEQVAPSPVPLPYTRRTWLLPGGEEVVEEVRPEYELTPTGDVINWRLIERRTVTPSGATVPGTAPTTSETIVPGDAPSVVPGETQRPPGGQPSPQDQEDLECGLPGKPPCKIDETGTPDGQGLAVPDLAPVTAPFLACVADPASCLPSLPALSWSFAMPTACGAIPLPAFASWGLESVDICSFQSTFHDLMSMVWIIGGLFGAIGLFWRKTLAVA